ncbi:2,3-diphosphoglycerate synthetase [Kitasatospora acidiphila]|uniref:2,3-diphosphoglycerate synthetase n=1 Tax=Kitasatospora acidiphila TaxID=2567942 RepID=A0A540WAJ8_9ACTN|nr:2,3-diphosphoglycerate synthetase [Kitasatospora acidiphila]TQF06051.1 2,3-diphosphoglycerate synthetase [Kitasatospora acidiphila]
MERDVNGEIVVADHPGHGPLPGGHMIGGLTSPLAGKRVLALVDGEHYPEVVRETLSTLPCRVVGAMLVGGAEKLRGTPDFGAPLLTGTIADAVSACGADLVLDLSDEPVVGGPERMAYAVRAMACGVAYMGADFYFEPPRLAPFALPSIGIAGTGKRIGKTAVSGHTARLLAGRWNVVVVAMGRGGPAAPEVVTAPPGLTDLLALSRSGRHAASDYIEDAVLAGVATVGARRCGGGFAAAPFASNVEAAAEMAAQLSPDLVLFEGSGTVLPPVEVRRRILVVGGEQDPDRVLGYLGAYRLLVSDLVVLTLPDPQLDVRAMRTALRQIRDVPLIAAALRPRPVSDVSGRRVAFFTTAAPHLLPGMIDHLRTRYGTCVVHATGALADRNRLQAELAEVDADVYLVELKAAAIDVVAEHAEQRGIPVVFCDTEVSPLPGEPCFDQVVLALADEALRGDPPRSGLGWR